MLSTKDLTHRQKHPQTESERTGGKYHSHRLHKQPEVSILISDKVYLKPKLIRRDKEGYFILLKGITQQEDIMTVNIYAPNNEASM